MLNASQVATRIRIFDTNPARTNSADLIEGFRQLLDVGKSVVVRGGSPFNQFALGFLQKIGSPLAILPPADPITAIETNMSAPNIIMSDILGYFEEVRKKYPISPLIVFTIEREKSVIYLTARPDDSKGFVSIVQPAGAIYELLNGGVSTHS